MRTEVSRLSHRNKALVTPGQWHCTLIAVLPRDWNVRRLDLPSLMSSATYNAKHGSRLVLTPTEYRGEHGCP